MNLVVFAAWHGRLALAARVAHSWLAVVDVPLPRSAPELPAPAWPTTSLA
jgi:hypothetical protein